MSVSSTASLSPRSQNHETVRSFQQVQARLAQTHNKVTEAVNFFLTFYPPHRNKAAYLSFIGIEINT